MAATQHNLERFLLENICCFWKESLCWHFITGTVLVVMPFLVEEKQFTYTLQPVKFFSVYIPAC